MKNKQKYIVYRYSGGNTYDFMTLEVKRENRYSVCNGLNPFKSMKQVLNYIQKRNRK